ncbi:MAG: histidine kinase [Proteobacteria bacterium]|nr:histidine kinase [Pseudomonadota bacterium]
MGDRVSDMLRFLRDLKIRGKLLAVVLPLVLLPVLSVGVIVGYVSEQQAYLGITQATRADLEHMTQFTLDLLNAHYRQFEVYKEDKQRTVQNNLATLARFAYNLVAVQQEQYASSQHTLEAAQQEARMAFKNISVGETGYLYAMTSKGDLTIHVAQEGEISLTLRMTRVAILSGRWPRKRSLRNPVKCSTSFIPGVMRCWEKPSLETRS